MKLSVLITTYNLKDYVEETLNSVLTQEVDFEYEILVGDDGSDDGTIEIVREYEKQYKGKIFLYVMDRQKGKKYNRIERASKNRMNLLCHAKGDYLIFLDGDDIYCDKHKLQKQVTVLDNPQNSDCIACAHNSWLYWNEKKKYLINEYKKEFKVDGRTYWRDTMYFLSNTVMFRNVFAKGIPSKINPNYYDDNIIIYCLLEYGKIIYIPDVMVNYRQLENSSWNSTSDVEKNLINLMDWDVEMQINPAYQKESVTRHIYDIFFVWKERNHISVELKRKYLKQMDRDHLVNSREWLLFSSQSNLKKCRMTLWLLEHMVIFAFNKGRKEILKKRYQ